MRDLATLRRLIAYDPETGSFTWKERPLDLCASQHGQTVFNAQKAGQPCREICEGYVRIRIMGRRILGHRLAWAFVHGRLPKGVIDHINGDRRDNRIVNLRDVTRQTNQRNMPINVKNTSGHPGVYRAPSGRWYAQIGLSRRRLALGTFDTFDEAKAVRCAAEREHGYIVRGAL
jgi:hypothetical protein